MINCLTVLRVLSRERKYSTGMRKLNPIYKDYLVPVPTTSYCQRDRDYGSDSSREYSGEEYINYCNTRQLLPHDLANRGLLGAVVKCNQCNYDTGKHSTAGGLLPKWKLNLALNVRCNFQWL